MTERSIVEAAGRLRRHGEPYLVATVVAVHGAAYRQPGARVLLTRYRWVSGAVTGGCLEGDLPHTGWARTHASGPVLLAYDATDPGLARDEDLRSAFGLDGDGRVEVLVERAQVPGRLDALEVSARCQRAQRRGAVATVFRSTDPEIRIGARLALIAGGQVEDEATRLPDGPRAAIAADLQVALDTGSTQARTYGSARGALEVLLEALLPPPRVFVIGTGHDAVPVAQLAHQLGWEVVVCAREARIATRERFGMVDELLVGSPAELGTTD